MNLMNCLGSIFCFHTLWNFEGFCCMLACMHYMHMDPLSSSVSNCSAAAFMQQA